MTHAALVTVLMEPANINASQDLEYHVPVHNPQQALSHIRVVAFEVHTGLTRKVVHNCVGPSSQVWHVLHQEGCHIGWALCITDHCHTINEPMPAGGLQRSPLSLAVGA